MKTKTLASQIKAMKVGDIIPLDNIGERAKVLAISRTLRQAGVIDFKITTTPKVAGGYTATAVPE